MMTFLDAAASGGRLERIKPEQAAHFCRGGLYRGEVGATRVLDSWKYDFKGTIMRHDAAGVWNSACTFRGPFLMLAGPKL